jgi:hypothetical protein
LGEEEKTKTSLPRISRITRISKTHSRKLLARQTDGAAVQLPPDFGGHPSTLARQPKIRVIRGKEY